MNDQRRRIQLAALERRFLALPEVDQLDFCAWVQTYLALERTLFDDEGLRRQETLACLRRAAAYLGLSRPPKVEEYHEAGRVLALAWSWQQIHRLWGSFSLAAAVAFGAASPWSAQQRAFMSRYGGKVASEREEYFTAVARWLATQPAVKTAKAYDDFARQSNYDLGDGELPLPRTNTMRGALAIPWRDIVAVAAGETDHPRAVAARRERRDCTRGPHDLIGVRTIALMRALPVEKAFRVTQDAYFPRPALVLANRRAWLRGEVERYFAGERLPLKAANRLRAQYLTARETAAVLGIGRGTLLKERRAELPPAGIVGGTCYWLRTEVEAYVAVYSAQVARRRRAQAKPGTTSATSGRTQFVTIMALAQELDLTLTVAYGLTQQAAFPPAVARFGKAGIWLRKEVEAFLAGRLVPPRAENALQESLIGSDAVAESLGYTRRAFGEMWTTLDLPAPVARPRGKLVWLKEDIDGWLAADPERVARRERRLANKGAALAAATAKGGFQEPAPFAATASSQASVLSGICSNE